MSKTQKTMTITDAFKAIRKDETLCARREDHERRFLCFRNEQFCEFSKGSQVFDRLNSEGMFSLYDILADWEVIEIANL